MAIPTTPVAPKGPVATDSDIPTIRPTLLDRDACYAEFDAIWQSGRVTAGPYTERLEEAIARRVETAQAICVGSCTAGLMLLQRALGLSGDVIIPTFTWTATGTSLLWNGCTPVFVDARPGDLTIDPNRIDEAVTPQTTAICAVAVFGVPSDRDRIAAVAKRHDLPVYYDAAQALGATYRDRPVGGSGVAEVFSLSPTKVVSAVEMGVVTTNDAELASRLRRMRDYGKSGLHEDITELGLSARPSEFHAVIGYHNLKHIDELIAHRGQMIAIYRARLAGVPGIDFQEIPPECTSTNNYVVIFLGEECRVTRDEMFDALKNRGIACKRYFYPCLHRQTVFQSAPYHISGSLAVSERAALQGLALPLYGHITEEQVNRVADAVIAACG